MRITNRSLWIYYFLVFSLYLISCVDEQRNHEINLELQDKITDKAALDSVLESYVSEGFYPFLYARLEDKEGRLLYEHSVKNDTLIPDLEIDEDSWIRIWSMSKIVTISLALDLVERGIMTLNDPVTKFIPEFNSLKVAQSNTGEELIAIPWEAEHSAHCPVNFVEPDSEMTVLHLINHQAGFYYATTGFSCIDSLVASQELPSARNSEELIDKLSQLPLIQHPGTGYFYGTNTTVLGLVAERATGTSLKELIETHITGPLNITGLQYGLPEQASLPPRISGKDSLLRPAQPGELDIFGPKVPDYELDHPLYLGGEGMVATAKGYAKFIRMLLNRGELNGYRLLEPETVSDMHAPHTLLDNPYGYNGYNLWVSGDTLREQGVGEAGLWIGGGYEGTHFWVDPKREFVGVIMTQMSFIPPGKAPRDDAFRRALYQQFWKAEGAYSLGN